MAADLRGLNNLMFDFTDDPAFVRDLFAFVVEMEIEFAKAQMEAGAELMGIGDAAASLIGPKRYTDFVLPFEKQLVAAIPIRTRLHICGNTRRMLTRMGEVGADIVDLDFLTPMAEGRGAMPDQTLLGNIDPVRVLRDGTPDTIQAALKECYEAAAPNYVVGAGCEIPRGTPHENIRAMTDFRRCISQ
jgi:MtaA/CmuA family methyltransferase